MAEIEQKLCTGGNTDGCAIGRKEIDTEPMNVLVIQITGTDLVLARFSGNRQQLSFLHGFRRSLPEDGSLATLLGSLGPRQGNEKVILAVPPPLVHARELSIPITDRRKLRELLPMELSGEIASGSDELVFDAVVSGEGKALAVWCRKKDVAHLVGELAGFGLEPEVVTASHLHWNLLLAPSDSDLTAVTDGSALVVVNRTAPLMIRPFSPDSYRVEMERSISAFELATGLPVQNRLYVGTAREGGGGNCGQGLTDTFAGDSVAAHDLAGAYAVAAAFMAGGIVNFRTGDLACTRGERELLKRLRLTGVLALTLVLLLFSEAGVRYWLASRDVASLERSIYSIYREIFPSRKKPVDPVGEVRAEIRRMGRDGSGRKILPVLKRLAELKGGDISGLYEIEVEGAAVRLKGDAKTAQAVNDFKLRSAEFFSNPEVSEFKTRGDGGVSFVFRGVAGEAGE